MDVVELLSPHVAMPVIGVIVCAFMVFAFGFRSPVQPPTLLFEEQDKRITKRKFKSTKNKSSSNGHVVKDETPVEEAPTPKQVKEVKADPSPKNKSKAVDKKPVVRKEQKVDNKKDKSDKKNKTKEEAKKVAPPAVSKKVVEDDGEEWTTIAVTKKVKKTKASKKEAARGDAAAEIEPEVVAAPVAEAAAAASPADDGWETPAVKKDKKKKKVAKEPEPVVIEETKPTPAAPKSTPDIEALVAKALAAAGVPNVAAEDAKKKKNKKEKKANDAGAASSSDHLPQDAAPASGKREVSPPAVKAPKPAPIVDEDGFTMIPKTSKDTPKKKKSKAKAEPAPEPAKPKTAAAKPTEKVAQAPPLEKKASPQETLVAAKTDTPLAAPAASPVTFDEIGDSWVEAAPKTKKKKARRDN